MKITIDGISELQERIEGRKNRLKSKSGVFLERLSTLGAYRARLDFSAAMYAGHNDVQLSVEREGDAYLVVANGNAVAFIEFGTGILNPEHPWSADLGFSHGTYGAGKGANPNGWVYVGEQGNAGQPVGGKRNVYRTYGNPPARAMYNASKDMRESILAIAKEVFGGGQND